MSPKEKKIHEAYIASTEGRLNRLFDLKKQAAKTGDSVLVSTIESSIDKFVETLRQARTALGRLPD